MSRNQYYILEGHKAVQTDFTAWAVWFETADRRVAFDALPNGVNVSTVFMGLNHSFGCRVPVLFETMIFGGKFDETLERYPTWQDAEAGHAKWVDYVKADQSRSFKQSENRR